MGLNVGVFDLFPTYVINRTLKGYFLHWKRVFEQPLTYLRSSFGLCASLRTQKKNFLRHTKELHFTYMYGGTAEQLIVIIFGTAGDLTYVIRVDRFKGFELKRRITVGGLPWETAMALTAVLHYLTHT